MASDSYERIYAVVRRIPRGRVATYGQVARLAGLANHARQVGYALHALSSGTRIPWHRVVAANGVIAKRANPDDAEWQRIKLAREGVLLNASGRVSIDEFGWTPGR
jgi:methylated-DNA-protein-cysteine methyltransferase related protein